MLNVRNYADYALCSDSAIMPKSNAGIIGPPQTADQMRSHLDLDLMATRVLVLYHAAHPP